MPPEVPGPPKDPPHPLSWSPLSNYQGTGQGSAGWEGKDQVPAQGSQSGLPSSRDGTSTHSTHSEKR